MYGEGIGHPRSAVTAWACARAAAVSSKGASLIMPPTGSSTRARTSSPSTVTNPPPMARISSTARSMEASSAPTTAMFMFGQFIEMAIAPRRRPNPRTNPTPASGSAWWRSITAIFRTSVPVSHCTRSPSTASSASKARLKYPLYISIARTRARGPSALTRSRSASRVSGRRMLSRVHSGTSSSTSKLAVPFRATTDPATITVDGRTSARSGMICRSARRDGARSPTT